MGFDSYIENGFQYKKQTISTPFGRLFGCTSYDSSKWHWCDCTDGDWYNEKLDSTNVNCNTITQLKCKLKTNIVPKCIHGK